MIHVNGYPWKLQLQGVGKGLGRRVLCQKRCRPQTQCKYSNIGSNSKAKTPILIFTFAHLHASIPYTNDEPSPSFSLFTDSLFSSLKFKRERERTRFRFNHRHPNRFGLLVIFTDPESEDLPNWSCDCEHVWVLFFIPNCFSSSSSSHNLLQLLLICCNPRTRMDFENLLGWISESFSMIMQGEPRVKREEWSCRKFWDYDCSPIDDEWSEFKELSPSDSIRNPG